jgi:hypothetical protein
VVVKDLNREIAVVQHELRQFSKVKVNFCNPKRRYHLLKNCIIEAHPIYTIVSIVLLLVHSKIVLDHVVVVVCVIWVNARLVLHLDNCIQSIYSLLVS